MSAYTTLRLTRKKAALLVLENLSDSKLEEMVDIVLRDRLYNCIIVDDDAGNDDDQI